MCIGSRQARYISLAVVQFAQHSRLLFQTIYEAFLWPSDKALKLRNCVRCRGRDCINIIDKERGIGATLRNESIDYFHLEHILETESESFAGEPSADERNRHQHQAFVIELANKVSQAIDNERSSLS
jgi:hypothetical protein